MNKQLELARYSPCVVDGVAGMMDNQNGSYVLWKDVCRATPPSPSTAQANSVEFGGIKSLEFGGVKLPSTAPIAEDERTLTKIDVKYEFKMWALRRGESAVYSGDGLYASGAITDQAEAFAAGVALARAALSSRPAGEVELPPLPEPRWKAGDFERWAKVYTDSETRAYGQECARAALASKPAAQAAKEKGQTNVG